LNGADPAPFCVQTWHQVAVYGRSEGREYSTCLPWRAVQAPRFEVDPLWPKPLPNHCVLGQAIGIWVDAQDNVWIIHRGSDTLNNNERGLELKTGDCCAGAPPVLVFDKAGNLIRPDCYENRSLYSSCQLAEDTDAAVR
jgi:hypothetical protein